MKAGCSSRTKTLEPDGGDPPGGGRLESLGVLAFSWVHGVYIPNTSPRDRGVLLACWEDFVIFSVFDWMLRLWSSGMRFAGRKGGR